MKQFKSRFKRTTKAGRIYSQSEAKQVLLFRQNKLQDYRLPISVLDSYNYVNPDRLLILTGYVAKKKRAKK